MGCASSAPKNLSEDPKDYPEDAFVIKIEKAVRVPSLDVRSESDPYVRVRSKGKTFARTHYKMNDPNPVWNQVLDVTGIRLNEEVDFDLWDKDFTNMNDRIGFSRISVRDLIKRPRTMMLVMKPGGSADFITRKNFPTELWVSIIKLPIGWPEPKPSRFETGISKEVYPKHVMIITRGTRGDVQPYLALARGLANTMGWCITICTELRYKDFVQKSAEKLTRGAIRYRPSGGDTHSRIDKPIARWAMAHQSELMQLAMLARSEREFFASEPAFYFWVETLKPDALIYGFNMVNVAMILSEKFQIPAVGFMLQPTNIPSSAYPPLFAIDTHMISYFDRLERSAANHDFLQSFKRWMEDDPIWAPLSTMRERRGLRPFKGKKSETFNILLKQNAPVVVPINEIAFGGRPSDWPSSIVLTDFIFLQGEVVPKLSPKIIDFIDVAHAAGDPVVAMTFSSMPVSRGDIIQSALRIVNECESHPRVIALSGSKVKDKLSAAISKELQAAVDAGKILELEGAPFGLLFERLDALCVHGGLGTTAEAMRAGIPTTVVGVLLMDQRFWGMQCEKLGIGAPMVHIASWKKKCVGVVDAMLKPDSSYKAEAKELAKKIQPKSADGVPENVQAIVKALETAVPFHTGGARKGRAGSSETVDGPHAYGSKSSMASIISSEDATSSSAAEDSIILEPLPAMTDTTEQTPVDVKNESKREFWNRISRRMSLIKPELDSLLKREEGSEAAPDVPGDDKDEFVE